MKLKGLAITLELAVTLVILSIVLFSGIAWAGLGWLRNYQSDMLRDKCNQLDYALRRYGQNHLITDVASEHFDEDGNFFYSMLQTYPSSQTNLSELHTLGYLHHELKLEEFQTKLTSIGVEKDTSVTFYTVNDDCTKYKVEVMLPNGKKYITPGSSSF